MKIKIFELFVIKIFTSAFFSGCAITHKYGPYSGKIVELETEAPIEGAVILIEFETEYGTFGGTVTVFADAVETVTDENGEYKIPGHRIFVFRLLHGWSEATRVQIFKPGYGCYIGHKKSTPYFPHGSLPEKKYVIVKLPKLRSTQERKDNYGYVSIYNNGPINKHKKLRSLKNIERIFLYYKPFKKVED